MINNSKILTVSYGTFSCTLEGFDDSFTTMKAIAEYFRDLASDDRYFGAEPPTPDAEMLARIAEREIERRVEAREDGGKIVLSAKEAAPAALMSAPTDTAPAQTQAAPEPQAQAPQTAPTPAPQQAEATTDTTEDTPATARQPEGFTAPMPAREAAQPTSQDVADAADDVEPDAVSADADVADVVDEPQAEAETDTAPELTELADNTDTDTDTDTDTATDADVDAADTSDDAQPEMPDTLADFASEVDDAAEDTAPLMAAQDVINHPDPDSVAAKLSRIRSVVAQNEQPYSDTAYSEDEHANDFLETNLADLDAALAEDDAAELSADAAADEARAEIEDDTAEVAVEAEEIVSEQDDDNMLLASISALSDDTADDDAPSEPTAPQAEEVAEDAPLELTEDELVEPKSFDPIEDTLAQLMADALPADEAPEASFDEGQDEEHADADQRPLNVRVMKVKKSDLDAALNAGELQQAPDDVDAANLFNDENEDEDDVESTLSPEEEAELQRELAEVEADFAPEAHEGHEAEAEAEVIAEADEHHDTVEDVAALADDPAEDLTDDLEDVAYGDDDAHENDDLIDAALEEAATAAARGVDRLQSVEQTSDVSRIFDEVDQQREEPGSSERRNAIQHLRAAVEATRADQNAGVEISKDKDDSAYRSDLADVVRPRRPRTGTTTRSQRPGSERPAPLKLVAEQRIDTPHEPVRPRRITTSDLAEMEPVNLSDTDGSFADFAEEMGAGSLPELLEAAAAYMADVEGRPQFSRPMLMGKLKEVEGDAFSREDGLRSFGQLLRQGKLQKLKGGRFAITDETEYRAQARNVG
ncbi:MAG: hypothetical protein AB8B82_11940 [Roseovarius sp.]